MNTATRLGVYGAGLALVFGGAFVAADAVVPDTVSDWTERRRDDDRTTAPRTRAPRPLQPLRRECRRPAAATCSPPSPLRPSTGKPGTCRSASSTTAASPDRVRTSHEKELHLIVVRTDGTGFRHVHPTMDTDGTWSLPWEWDAAGTYRVYADFVPDDRRQPRPSP